MRTNTTLYTAPALALPASAGRSILRGAALLVLVSGAVAQSALPEIDADDSDAPRIVSPSLGRPVFVEPGGEFELMLHPVPAAGALQAQLSRGGVRRALRLVSADGPTVRFQVDPDCAPRTHDLEVVYDGQALRAAHCVAVWHRSERIRLVQLCNPPPPGDAAARALADAVNLLAPSLVLLAGTPDPTNWERLSNLVQNFEAPVLIALGPRDDLAGYSAAIAASPVGAVELGSYRGLVLCDHANAPLESDLAQVRWLEQLLARGSAGAMTFAISYGARPSLLRLWKEHGVLERAVRRGRLGLWLTGEARAESAAEREIAAAARPLLLSSAPLELGRLPSLRVVDIEHGRVRLPLAGEHPGTPLAIAPSQLSMQIERAGSEALIEASSGLPGALDGLALWIQIEKSPAGRAPNCRGARLEEIIDAGAHWECRIGFDLPAAGRMQALLAQ